MEYLPGFKWAVPKAFSDAVASCCFEEGDVLYDTPLAYEGSWGEAKEKIQYHLQVKYPARGSSQSISQGSVFEGNWEAEVRLELYKNQSKVVVGHVHTTQGRLYSMLWRGDINLIIDSSSVSPLPPKGTQEITKALGMASIEANILGQGAPVFIMVRDVTSAISNEKYQIVKQKLNVVTVGNPIVQTPEEAGIINSLDISPTIQIVFFVTNLSSVDELEMLVKQAVYVPSKDAEKDMFRISAHGRVYPSKSERQFIYQDAKGNVTERNVYSVTESEDYIQGICRKSNGIRTFRKDRVLEVIIDPSISGERLKYFKENSPVQIKVTRSSSSMDVCFTGFKKDDKERLTQLAGKNNLNIRSSVTKNLSYLCCGYNAGPKKIESARKQGVVVLSEKQFRAMLETGELPEEFNG
ncbi:MAG: hypothetical protein R8L53_00250 [Mariprofundales bacterium]